MKKQTASVRVPATVGNFGGAGDAAALALEVSLNVKATRRLDGHLGIRYFGEDGERVPRDRSNLVVRALEAALGWKELEFTGADIEIYSSIPVAVGLGSSTAAVLAGLMAADALYELGIDEKSLFDLASTYENRRTNLRAAWLGGLVVSAKNAPTLDQLPVAVGYEKRAVADTSLFRVVVPEISRGSAEHALEEALRTRASGDVNIFMCGSGPGVGIFSQGDSDDVVRQISEIFARRDIAFSVFEIRPSNTGAPAWNSAALRADLLVAEGLSVSLPGSHSFPM